jgi:3-dehydroquinate dehydratase II
MSSQKRPKSIPTRNILIASGVNLDLLGTREPHIYGSDSLADMKVFVAREFKKRQLSEASWRSFRLEFFQSNDEATFLAKLSAKYSGVVINPGSWTHTSLAIADRLKGLSLPYIETHVSDLSSREAFRQFSFVSAGAIDRVTGLGIQSYWVALEKLLTHLLK